MHAAAAHGVPLRTIVAAVALLAAACLLTILAYRLRAFLLLFLVGGPCGGALAAVPVVLYSAVHSLTVGIVTLVLAVYARVEMNLRNPAMKSWTVRSRASRTGRRFALFVLTCEHAGPGGYLGSQAFSWA